MYPIKAVKTVNDSVKFVLKEADLMTKKNDKKRKKYSREVPYTRNLQWAVKLSLIGASEDSNRHISIHTSVTAPTVVKSTYSVDRSSIQKSFTRRISKPTGYSMFASYEELRSYFRDGKVTITCDVEVYVPVPWSFLTNNMFQTCKHIPTDFTLIVGGHRLESHKHLLSFVSPVFNAMFSHDLAESKSGTVTITDFDYATVKAAIDFLYGRELEDPTIDVIVGVLRFADKYDINFFTDLEPVPFCNLSLERFSAILHYAYDCSRETLLEHCAKFYYDRQYEIKTATGLDTIHPEAIIKVIETAFGFTNVVEVFCQAYENDVDVIMVPLADKVADSLSINNFCEAVKCALDCSFVYLLKKCAVFLSQNWMELTHSTKFLDLDAETIKDIMTMANEVGNDEGNVNTS